MTTTLTAQQYARVNGAYNDVLDLNIGPLKKRLQVHKGLATSESGFLQSAVHPHWTRAADEGIDLSDYDVPAVGMFFAWLYHQSITLPSRTLDQSSDTLLVERILIKAYIPFLQIILPPPDAISEAFEGTCDNDALRRLIVNTSVDVVRRKAYPKLKGKGHLYHIEFYQDFTQQLVTQLSEPATQAETNTADDDSETSITKTSITCEYHQHSAEEPISCRPFSCDQFDLVTPDEFYNGIPRSKMIKILVGPERLPFHTYQTNLVYADSYPEIKPETFENYMHWQVLGWTPSMIMPHLCKSGDLENALTALVDLFYIAYHIKVRTLRNDVIEAVTNWMVSADRAPSIDAVDYAFELSTKSNMLTELFAFVYACEARLPISGSIRFYQSVAVMQKALQTHAALRGAEKVYIPTKASIYVNAVRCILFHEHLGDDDTFECKENIENIAFGGKVYEPHSRVSSEGASLRTYIREGMAELGKKLAASS